MNNVLQLDEIKRLVRVPALIDAIETGFALYSAGKVNVPPVGFLHFEDPPGDVHIKYGAIADDSVYVLKVASAFTSNPQLGLPSNDGLMLVFSQQTGRLELILQDQGWLTDMRTAAAGAVAAKHLAPRKVTQIGIVGTGVQARLQLALLADVVDCQRCLVWGRNPAKVQAMIDELRSDNVFKAWGLEIRAAESIDALVTSCNLIVTTTPAKSPLIRADQVQPGTHITAMGSDDHGKQELESGVLGMADVVAADSMTQCVEHGECRAAVVDGTMDSSSIVELGHVISNPLRGRSSEEQITIADLTGVAIQDIQIAKMVAHAYSNATPSDRSGSAK